MTATELQAVMARLYVDEPFRRLSRLDPKATIDRYVLTEHERSAVLGLDASMLDFFAASLRNKRRHRFELEFPSTFYADRSRALQLWDRFYDLLGTNPYVSAPESLVQFGRFLHESVRGDGSWPKWLPEMIRFETLVCGLQPVAASDDRPDAPVPDRDARMILASGVSLHVFTMDVLAMEEAIRSGVSIVDPKEGATAIAVTRRPDSTVRSFRLSEPAHVVATWCDGTRTLDQLVDAAEGYFGVVGLGAQIEALLQRLVSLGVVSDQSMNVESGTGVSRSTAKLQTETVEGGSA